MLYPLLLIALTGLLAGCGSFLPEHRTLPGPSAVEVYQARREPPPPIEPALSVMPNAPINEPQPATINQTPMPVWNDAQLVRVDLDAYVNEKGEAFGPSVKYVVKQPGGWNVDALRNPTRAYVPTENVPPVPSKTGYTANPLVSPGSALDSAAPQVRPLQPSLIQDLGSVRVTGFVERSQEPLARSMAQNGEVPLFDESLGWILVPSSALVPSNQIPAPQPVYQPVPQSAYPNTAPLGQQVMPYPQTAAPQAQMQPPPANYAPMPQPVSQGHLQYVAPGVTGTYHLPDGTTETATGGYSTAPVPSVR